MVKLHPEPDAVHSNISNDKTGLSLCLSCLSQDLILCIGSITIWQFDTGSTKHKYALVLIEYLTLMGLFWLINLFFSVAFPSLKSEDGPSSGNCSHSKEDEHKVHESNYLDVADEGIMFRFQIFECCTSMNA